MTIEEAKEKYGIQDLGGYVNCADCPCYNENSPTLRDCCNYAEKYYLICDGRALAWRAIVNFMEGK